MASIEHDRTERNAPTGTGKRVALLGAAVAVLTFALVWIVSAFTEPDPVATGRDAMTDPGPEIVTDPAMAVEAPLSPDAQGATRTELGTTPPDTTPD